MLIRSERSTLEAGVAVKGQFRCTGCGYGVTVYRVLPLCPMCHGDTWQQASWSPFRRARVAPPARV